MSSAVSQARLATAAVTMSAILSCSCLLFRSMNAKGTSNDWSASKAPPKPQDVLLKQLSAVDEVSNPSTARTLHTALGHIHLGIGDGGQALHHFTSARNAAIMEGDITELAQTRLTLSEVYLRQGQAIDAFGELEKTRTTMNLPTSFKFPLAVGLGHAKRDLRRYDAALKEYEEARALASAPEEHIEVLSDIGELRILQGQHTSSLEVLRRALSVADASSGIGGSEELSVAGREKLLPEIHFRLAEALRKLNKFQESFEHYSKALQFENALKRARPDLFARIKEGIQSLQQAEQASSSTEQTKSLASGASNQQGKISEAEPSQGNTGTVWQRRMKERLTQLQSDPMASPSEPTRDAPSKKSGKEDVTAASNPTVASGLSQGASTPGIRWSDKVSLLMDENKLSDAEITLVELLASKGFAPGESSTAEVAAMLNMLGRVHRRQQRFLEAGERFMQALAVGFGASGARSSEAKEAYQSLSYVQVSLFTLGQGDAAKKISADAIAAADAAGIPERSPERRTGERRLRANAAPTVVPQVHPQIITADATNSRLRSCGTGSATGQRCKDATQDAMSESDGGYLGL